MLNRLMLSIFILLALALPLYPQASDSLSLPAEDGAFEFNGLSLTPRPGSVSIRGSVLNKTGRDWRWVSFEVMLYDKSGKAYAGLLGAKPTILIKDFKKDSVQALDGAGSTQIIFVEAYFKPVRFSLRLAEGRYNADYAVTLSKPVLSESLAFEDEFLAIKWIFNKEALGFVLRNKTDNPIKLDWNQVSYIDIEGSAQKVIHKDVRLINRNDPQAPTVIPPTARIEDLLIPTGNISYKSGRAGGWEQHPMFPDGGEAKAYQGKSFSIFMPLEINGTVKNYTFTIQITDVKY